MLWGEVTEEEKNNLLMNANCAACYVAGAVRLIEFRRGNAMNMHCNDYHTVGDKIDYLINYIVKCIDGKEKFNIWAYTRLRKAIMKKMYIVAHLEWGYEENEV